MTADNDEATPVNTICGHQYVIDAETLRDAQKNPDRYSNLLIRVTGYNAFYTQIGRELQAEIIARTEHTV